ncbi:glycoside hydrolase [Fluviispira multicolorata]|nr:glycoside hydrolase [Fluviispira multicolorata]
MKIQSLIPVITILFTFTNAYGQENNLQFRLKNWKAIINPESLKVLSSSPNGLNILTNPIQSNLGSIDKLKFNNSSASWVFPEKQLTVSIKVDNDNLVFNFTSNKNQILEWPSTKEVTNAQDLIIPDGEGLLIPLESKFWQNAFEKYYSTEYEMASAMTMPFYAIRTKNSIITYLSDSSLNNLLYVKNSQNKIFVTQTHEFRKIDNYPPYQISINLMQTLDPLAPAKLFKENLIKNSKFKTLTQKENENPNIKKLYGAMHSYVWGTGRTEDFLNDLRDLKINNLWIGSDVGESDKYKITQNYIQKAINLGYLIGPYDTWENLQNPKTADTPLAIFPNAWPKAAIINKNGSAKPGFQNRGYEASSQYFAMQNPINKDLKDRLNKFAETGINSYFLDVDATGTLHDDYSPTHPMNIEKDLQNRISRLKLISQDKKLVLGSETAVYQFVPYIAFAHGNASVFNGPHWKLTRDKKTYGRWYPTERPSFFFNSLNAPEEYKETKYNPTYRIPLFQTVFHDSIITTDRWEIPITKFRNLMNDRILLELLYGIPSIWALDKKQIKMYSKEIKNLNAFFSPLHKKIATLPMTQFEWLTENKCVQRTQFGNEVQLTANFSNNKFENIPAKSIELNWLKENKKEIYTP